MSPHAPRSLVRGPLQPDLQSACIALLASQSLNSEPAALVVPHRALGQALLRAAARAHGLAAGVRVLTWVELALLLTGLERPAGRRLLGGEARTWLVRQLHPARGRAATCFDPVLDVRGIRAALLRTFEELGRAGLSSSLAVQRVLAARGSALPSQVRDALLLYHAYRRSFEETHDDTAMLLERAAATPAGRLPATLGGSKLLVYGFDTLECMEKRLLAHLARDPSLELHLFAPSTPPVDAELQTWLDQLGCDPRPAPPMAPPAARLHVLATPSDEAQAGEIARQLLAAVDEGMRFGAMAVVVRGPRRLELLRSTLVRCGIPCTQHPSPSVGTTRAARALLAALDCAALGLAPQPVLDFLSEAPLRPGWAGLEPDPIPSAWERVARATALASGIDDWRAKLVAYVAAQEREAEEREREASPSGRARAAARAATELAAIAVALEARLAAFPERGPWSAFSAQLASWLEEVLAPVAETPALRGALERLAALDALGEAPGVTRAEYREALRAVLQETPLPEPAPAIPEAVQLGTATSLPAVAYDLVCIAGAQEGEWPGGVPEDPVLLPRDRELLQAQAGEAVALPVPEDVLARERRLFATWCGAARRRLVVAYARFDPASGAPRLPSSLVLQLVEERTGRRLGYQEFESAPQVERVPLRRTAFTAEVPALGVDELDSGAVLSLPPVLGRRYVQGLGLCARRGLALDRLRNQYRRFTSVDGKLHSARARQLLAARVRDTSFSATQLATYATCPYRYFLRHLLRVEHLEPAPAREASGLEVGRLVHAILERLYRQRQVRERAGHAGGSGSDLQAELAAAVDEVLEAANRAGRIPAGLLWEIRLQQLREDLHRYLQIESRTPAGDWQPVAFELRFGPRATHAPVVRGPLGPVALHGFIDRLDRDVRQGGLRVVDYKTGRPVARRDDPRAVQLAIYLDAVTDGDPRRLAGSDARFVHVTRRGRFVVQQLEGTTLAAHRDDLQRFVLTIVAGITAGEFFPEPGDGGRNCTGCDYESLCEARVVQQNQRKVGAGQDRSWRNLPDFAAHLNSIAGPALPPAAPGGEA